MPAVARIGDTITTGHGCDSTSQIKQGSSNVFANGRGITRVGDSDTHNIPTPTVVVGEDGNPVTILVCLPHTVTVGSGSSSVFVNGRAIARVGDSFSGESITTGSPNVFAG
jgi:uncharacterized Zn-binding protein involved in type VI secretion